MPTEQEVFHHHFRNLIDIVVRLDEESERLAHLQGASNARSMGARYAAGKSDAWKSADHYFDVAKNMTSVIKGVSWIGGKLAEKETSSKSVDHALHAASVVGKYAEDVANAAGLGVKVGIAVGTGGVAAVGVVGIEVGAWIGKKLVIGGVDWGVGSRKMKWTSLEEECQFKIEAIAAILPDLTRSIGQIRAEFFKEMEDFIMEAREKDISMEEFAFQIGFFGAYLKESALRS